MSIKGDDVRQFLDAYFGREDDDVQKFLQLRSDVALSKEAPNLENKYKFVCMQTASVAFEFHRSPEANYHQIVRNAFKDFDAINYNTFVSELVQNSIDHCTDKDDEDIEINIEISEDSMVYEHNGIAFDFENQETSTMAGLLTTGTELKKYDFRHGMFGIGFKSWISFYQNFKLVSICNGMKFTLVIDLDEKKKRPAERFVLNDCSYEQTNDRDTIRFEFSNPIKSWSDDDISSKITAMINSFTSKNITLKYNDKSNNLRFTLATKSKNINIGGKDIIESTTLKNGEEVSSRYVLKTDISELKELDITTNSVGKYTVDEYLIDIYQGLSKESLDTDLWYAMPTINIYTKGEGPYLLSSLMPIRNGANMHLSNKSRTVFDAKFILEPSRQNILTSTKRENGKSISHKQFNGFILKEMMKQHLQFLRCLENTKHSNLMFVDSSYHILEFFKENRMLDLEHELVCYYLAMKETFIGSMINASGENILELDLEPKRIPLTLEVLEWCNKNISDDNRKTHFPMVPSDEDGLFISEKESIAVKHLDKLSVEDFINKVESSGKLADFLAFTEICESMKELQENLPLPDGYNFVILQEDDLEENVSAILTTLSQGKKYKVFKREDIGYERFEKLGERKGIFHANSTCSTQDLFDFILTNIGGKSIDDDDWELLSQVIGKSVSLVKADISMWDEDDFCDSIEAIVHIPKFDDISNCRSIDWSGENNHQACTWIGMPHWQKNNPSEWWIAEKLPTKASELTNIIFKSSCPNEWNGEENCSIIVGKPINSPAICKSFGESVLRNSKGFIKVDLDPKFDTVAHNRWRSPFPRALVVDGLNSFNVGEYDIKQNATNPDVIITDARPIEEHQKGSFSITRSENAKHLHQMHTEVEEDYNAFMHEIVWPKIKKGNLGISTTGFIVRFQLWKEIFFQGDLEGTDREVSLYSQSLKFVKASDSIVGANFSTLSRDFAARFGRYNNQRPITLAFTWLPTYMGTGQYPNKVGDGILSKDDDFWTKIGSPSLKRKNKKKPLIGDACSEQTVNHNLFTDYTLVSCDFDIPIQEFLGGSKDEEIEDWYDSLGEILAKINPQFTLDETRKKELINNSSNQEFIQFIESADTSSMEELRHKLLGSLDTNRDETIRNFSTKKDKEKLHSAFYTYIKGSKSKIKNNTSTEVKLLSDVFYNKFLRPTPKGKDTLYLGWVPTKDFRKIDTMFSRLLGIGTDYPHKHRLLINNSTEGNIEQLEDDITEFDNNIDAWGDSFEVLRLFVTKQKGEEYDLHYLKCEKNEPSKLFSGNLSLGIGGWDIRINQSKKEIYVLNSDNSENAILLQSETLRVACEKFLKMITRQAYIFEKFDQFCQEENRLDVFVNRNAWAGEYTNQNLSDYIESCNQDGIISTFDKIKLGIRQIWDSEGVPAPGSEGEKQKTWNVRRKSNEVEDIDNYRPTNMDKEFINWYNLKSMAANEFVINDGLKPLYKNIFKFHSANNLVSNKPSGYESRKTRPMTKFGIDRHIGSIIQTGTLFGRLAENKGKLDLNSDKDKNGNSSLKERVVDAIEKGELEITDSKILTIEDALLVDGKPSTLRIHVLHAVAMAAMEEFLNEIEEDK